MGYILRQIIFAASAFTTGLATYLAVADVLGFLRTRQRLQIAYATTWAGVAITIGLILWYIVVPIEDLGVRPETWSFAFGLGLTSLGFSGIAVYRRSSR